VLELFILGVLVLVGITVFGLLWSAVAFFLWVLFLPFKLLGLAFRGVACLLALPFLLIIGLVGVALFGAGLLVFMIPAMPIVLLALGAWWLVRRSSRAATAR